MDPDAFTGNNAPLTGESDVDLRLLNHSMAHSYDTTGNCDNAVPLANEKVGCGRFSGLVGLTRVVQLSKSSSNASHKRKRSGSESRYQRSKRSRSKDQKKKEK